MDNADSGRRRQGPYRTRQRVPRQTIYSRKKKLPTLISFAGNNLHVGQLSVSTSPECTSCENDTTVIESYHKRTSDSDMENSEIAMPLTLHQLTDEPEVVKRP